jgi:hypothetical protein
MLPEFAVLSLSTSFCRFDSCAAHHSFISTLGLGLIRFGGQINYVGSAPRSFVFDVDHRRSAAVM